MVEVVLKSASVAEVNGQLSETEHDRFVEIPQPCNDTDALHT